jgi:hypothetical protein
MGRGNGKKGQRQEADRGRKEHEGSTLMKASKSLKDSGLYHTSAIQAPGLLPAGPMHGSTRSDPPP